MGFRTHSADAKRAATLASTDALAPHPWKRVTNAPGGEVGVAKHPVTRLVSCSVPVGSMPRISATVRQDKSCAKNSQRRNRSAACVQTAGRTSGRSGGKSIE